MNPCSVCPLKYRPLEPSGPVPAQILAIGERPGQTENRTGVPFSGPSGSELNILYLPLAGLDRRDIRVSNAVLCAAESDRTPSDKELAVCAKHHLPEEIRRSRCQFLILMGGIASRLVPGINLEMHHGIPRDVRLYGHKVTVVPMYHSALGLHESRWMTVMMEDWDQLPYRLHNRFPQPVFVLDYKLAEDPRDLRDYLSPLQPGHLLAIDTEDHAGVPWSVQVSFWPGSARLILANNRDCISVLRGVLGSGVEAVFHNAPHDIEVLRRMGLCVTRFADTQQETFHQGNLPQGLKPLSYRLFRAEMTSWEDVVRPASITALIEWTVEALQVARADLTLFKVEKLKTKLKETPHKSPAEGLFDRLLRHTAESSDYNPWERLNEFWADPAHDWMTSHISARCGPWPLLGIANCSLDRAVRYGCGDADFTLRAALELDRLRADIFPVPEEEKDR